MLKTAVPLLCTLLLAGANATATYLITAPSSIQPGTRYTVNVNIENATSVFVQASLEDQKYNGLTGNYDTVVLVNDSSIFSGGIPGTLNLSTEADLRCSSCQVRFRGTGDLQFEQVIYAALSYQVAVILVQTDKAIYKLGQTVRFRAFAVYSDLQLYEGAFSIEIKDPNNNKIKVLTNVTSPTRVVEDSLKLSEQPVFGTWSITVNLLDVTESYTQTFEVAEYELPRFEVTIEVPSFALISDESLSGVVKARYTFGKPVKGFVELHVGPNQGPNSCGDLPRTTQIGFAIDGEKSFTIRKEDIERAVSLYNGQEVRVTAFVKEDATGVRLNGSSVIKWYSNKYQIKFADNTPSVFKAGLPYTVFIQVTTPDNKPPTDNNITVSVYTYVSYQLNLEDQALYDTPQFTGTYPLPGKNVTLPASGLLPVDIDIPSNATSITVKTSVKGVYATKTIEKMYSQSNTFIQLSVLDKNVKAGSTVHIKLDGTEELYDINYEILSRGTVVASGLLNGNGQKSFNAEFEVTPEFAPTAHLIAYYTKEGEDEIIADSLAFNVDGIFNNKVTISFNKNESETNQNVTVEVTAEPDSEVHILAVDQSVLLLKSGNDITPAKVSQAVSKFDKGDKPSDSEYALSNSAANVQEIFSKIGLSLLTNVPFRPPPSRYEPPMPFALPGALGGFSDVARNSFAKLPLADSSGGAELQAVEVIRSLFPEVWLWINLQTGENGTATIEAPVPDTITSWIASAFATNNFVGLGVAPTTATLKVFRPFFVSLTYASTVVQGEQVVIQAVVFNYLNSDLDVTVIFKGSSKFQHIKQTGGGLEIMETGDQLQEVHVESNQQGVVYFPIYASDIGTANIEITAQSKISADGVRRQITIRPAGAPVSYNYPIFVNLDKNGTFETIVNISLPNSVVNGSDNARIKTTGDLIGSSLSSLRSLLRLPTGCGEQSMVYIAPNVYIAQYLQTTGQLIAAIKDEIVDLLETGYQRQLTYQRYDGGFSPFGNRDDTGSTWLTAYVCRVLYESKQFIYLDPRVLVRCTDWLVERQNKDGSFNEFGKVLDSTTQGTGSIQSLTAFALLSYLKTNPLSTIDCIQGSECYRTYQWGNATANAISYLESLVNSDSINDQFSLALITYALAQAQSSKAEVALVKLETFAHHDGGLLFWKDNSTVKASPYLNWRPPHIQSTSKDITITSYAILALVSLGKIEEAFPAVQWLINERNPDGGFVSSQDTSVALQALAAFASKSIRPDTDLIVKVTNDVRLVEFHIDNQNALVLQIEELPKAPTRAVVNIDGQGFALVEIDVNFNTDRELNALSFDVSTVLLDDDLDSFNLMICTKSVLTSDTGMVVQEISIPSGFDPDLESLGNVAGLKRSERRGNEVNVYFDSIGKTSTCYNIRMTRTDKVARTQENYVTTYPYYTPENRNTNFWQPTKLRDATTCDVCFECCQ